jgi:predicted CXXCH cytochrome family protein
MQRDGIRRVSVILGILVFAGGRACGDDKPCLDCHDMIRTNYSNGKSHPTIVPGCAGCHGDHTQSSASTSKHYLIAPASVLCSRCHAGVGDKEFAHAPVKMDCTVCHDPHGGSRAGLRAESNALCLECHSTASGAKFESNSPATLFGGQVSLPPHAFQNLRLLALSNDRGHPVSNHPVLLKADDQWPAISCTVCHNPHGADKSASMLVTESESVEPLCQRCHK